MPETIIPTFASVARRVWYWTVVRGVLAIVFGTVALLAPISTAVSLAVVVAIFAVVDGIFEIIDGIRHRAYGGAGLRVLQGVLTLGFGVVLVVWPEITTLAIIWTIAVWAVVVGIIQVVVALSLRRVAGSGWGWGVVSGLVSVIFGGLVLARPAAGLVSIIWVLGVFAIMLGVLLVGFGLQVRRLGKEAGALAEGGDRRNGASPGAASRDGDPADGAAPAAQAGRAAAHLAPEGSAEGQAAGGSARAAEHVPNHLQPPAQSS